MSSQAVTLMTYVRKLDDVSRKVKMIRALTHCCSKELTSLNDRDADLINGHLDTIQETSL